MQTDIKNKAMMPKSTAGQAPTPKKSSFCFFKLRDFLLFLVFTNKHTCHRLDYRQNKNNDFLWCRGQAMLIAAIFFLIISTTVILGLAIPISKQIRIASDLVKSRTSLFLAEAGLEDVVYRIKNNFEVSSSEQINLDDHEINVTVEDVTQGKIVTAEGDHQSYFRKIRTRLVIAEGTAFNYGVQVGDGGLQMGNNSEVHGNVFSNGNISAANNARVFGTVIVAGTNGLSGGRISVDAHVYNCSGGSRITEVLYTNTPGNCNYGSLESLDIFDPLDLPISNEEIENWKELALFAGGICAEPVCDEFGNYVQSGETSGSLGPIKIAGDLTVGINATLEVTGTLWVEGSVNIRNNANVHLSQEVYGPNSGMIISDGTILIDNDSVSEGSGEEESYIMYLSTSDSPQAIEIRPGDTEATIVYTNNGTIIVNNNVNLLEAIGYRIHLNNEAVITYETGLAHTIFINGPGGVFQVLGWREIE